VAEQTAPLDTEDVQYSGTLYCVGDLLVDILVTEAHRHDGMATGIFLRSGGSAANVAVWARRSGLTSCWVGSIGEDVAASILLSELHRESVMTLPQIAGPGKETGVVICRVGRRANRVMQSARSAASETVSEDQLKSLENATAIHLTGYSLIGASGPDQVHAMLSRCANASTFLSFDVSDADIVERVGPERIRTLLQSFGFGVLFTNAVEAQAMTRANDSRAAAIELANIAETAIVKLGSRGALVATGSQIIHVPAHRVVPIDTTGAGDAFAGTWLAHHLSGATVVHAAMIASEVAAKSTLQIGARSCDSIL
jgi:ribokinase